MTPRSSTSQRQSILLIDNLLSTIQDAVVELELNPSHPQQNEKVANHPRFAEPALISSRSSSSSAHGSMSRKSSVLHSTHSHRQSIRNLEELMSQLSHSNVAQSNDDAIVRNETLSDRMNRRMSKLENLLKSSSARQSLEPRPGLRIPSSESLHIPRSFSSTSFPSRRSSNKEAMRPSVTSSRRPSALSPLVAICIHAKLGIHSLSISPSCTFHDVLLLLNSSITTKLKLHDFEPFTQLTTWDQVIPLQPQHPLLLLVDLYSLTSSSKLDLKAYSDHLSDDFLDAYTHDDIDLPSSSPNIPFHHGEAVELVAWKQEIHGYGWIRGIVQPSSRHERQISVKCKDGHLYSFFNQSIHDRLRRPVQTTPTEYDHMLLTAGTRVEYKVSSEAIWAASIISGCSMETPIVYTIEKALSPAPLAHHSFDDAPPSPLHSQSQRSLSWRLKNWLNLPIPSQESVPGETVIAGPENIRVGWSVGLADAITTEHK